MTDRPRIRYSPLAETEIDEIADRIGAESAAAGRRFFPAVHETAKSLAKFPDSGTRVDFGDAEIRECRWAIVTDFKKYLLIYRPLRDGIEIVRVLHGARNLDELRA